MATRNVNRELIARNLPKTFGVTFKVPREACLRVVKRALVHAVHLDPQWNHDEKTWLLSRLRLVAGPCQKHSRFCNAPAVSKRTDAQEIVDMPNSYLSTLDKASDLDRIEKIWDVPWRPSVQDDRRAVSACIRRCCSCLRVDSWRACEAVSMAAESLQTDPCYMREQRVFKQTQSAYASYTADMSRRPGEVLVPDDKQRKFMWRVSAACYQWLLLKFACLAPAWELTTLTPEEAETWCQSTFRILIPDHLKKCLGVHKVSSILPYYYGTFKAKCFSAWQEVGHVCSKPLHSCLRKIVSCCKWPFRRRWRWIHRAWETVIRQSCPSDEIWSLKDACQIMSSRCKTAKVSDGLQHCGRCGCDKPTCVAITADAGQFFETVQPPQAIAAARRCLSRCARMHGHVTVSVLTGPKRIGFLGGSTLGKLHGVMVFAFCDLFLAFAACLFICYVSLGRSVFRLKGLPIGGVLSKVATSLVLGEEEFQWQCAPRRRRDLGFTATSNSWNSEVARGRYVDDLLWVSGVYCATCLFTAVQHCYTVDFELCESGEKVTWLDMCFHARCTAWSMKPKQWVLPPPWSSPKGFAHSFLCGRLARLDECKLSMSDWLDATVAILVGFRSAGWSKRVVRGAIFKSTIRRGKLDRTCLLLACDKLWG